MTFFLIGMPASGKTTFGEAFAAEQAATFIDLDAAIERATQRTIPDIFVNDGEAVFRKKESKILQTLDYSAPTVVATGGGTPCFNENMAFMRKNGIVLWLDPALYILERRLAQSTVVRPLFMGLSPKEVAQSLRQLYQFRLPFYNQAHYRCTSES